ncbi:hypothetical protein GCM10009802_08330 [Streptomyces synnematoformans]|uniref:Lipoprotein n=2 Tax=Streptomyces synnematoformans TaxID=415721 RepID=A0ABP5J4U0_9ACTN
MTQRPPAAAAVLAVAVLLTGCSLADDDQAPEPEPTTASPAPSGAGPYEEPADPTPAQTLPKGEDGTPHGGIPHPDDVDEHDASAVSEGALTAMFTYDTTIDASRNDAGRRAAEAGWCTEEYARQLRAAAARSAPGADWATWAEHRAYTTVKLTAADEAGRPADTPTTAYRQWNITVTPHGRNDWKGQPQHSTVFAELQRADPDAPWRLAAISIQ